MVHATRLGCDRWNVIQRARHWSRESDSVVFRVRFRVSEPSLLDVRSLLMSPFVLARRLNAPGNDNGLDAVAEPVNLRDKLFCGKGIGDLICVQQVVSLHMLVEIMQGQPAQRRLSQNRAIGWPIRFPDRHGSTWAKIVTQPPDERGDAALPDMMQGAVHGNEIGGLIELELSRVALDELEPVARPSC